MPLISETRPDHNTGNFVPYSLREVQATGPTVYRPFPRRLERITICRCHCKGSTFYSAILRP